MAYQGTFSGFHEPSAGAVGGFGDIASALAKGYQAGVMPAVTSADLLSKMLKSKYDAFKATPDYQSAMLDFLRGQGAHMWGQANLAPTQAAVNTAHADALKAQAEANQLKTNLYNQWLGGTGPKRAPESSQYQTSPQNVSDSGWEGQFTNAVYNEPGMQDGSYNYVSQGKPTDKESEQGLRDYNAERGLAAMLGIKEPQTFVDPNTGMGYAKLRDGRIVPTGKEVGEQQKEAASALGKAKGEEEAAFTMESPTDRRELQQLLQGVEKVNNGDFDAALGWRHKIPFGLNYQMSDQKIGEMAAFEKLLNSLKIKQQRLMNSNQGHITDYGRALLNATFPDISANPAAFKGQLNQLAQDLQRDMAQSKLIRKYKKEGLEYDEAKEKAQDDLDVLFPSITNQPPAQQSQGSFKNASYEPQPLNQSNDYGSLAADFGPQTANSPIAQSGVMQELQKYAPAAGNIAASSLLAIPHPVPKTLGAALAAGIGAYEAAPGKRLQGALENVGMDLIPWGTGRALGAVTGKNLGKNAIKATEEMFAKRVEPFEAVVSKANKLGDLNIPQQISNVKDKLSAALAGHTQNWTKQLDALSKLKNNPIFGNAQKAQSALGQIERADVAEPVRAMARDMRKRILGSMQTHLTEKGSPSLLKDYSAAMKEYAKSGPMLKDLMGRAKDMTGKEFIAHLKSLRSRGQLPEDLSGLLKQLRRRETAGKVVKETAKAIAPGVIPAGAISAGEMLKSIFRGI